MMPAAWQSDWRDIREDDLAQVERLLASGSSSVVSGGILARFEKDFAAFAGTRHAVAVNSGTSALYAALWAVGVGPGDDVLVCDYGFHVMAAAVITLGARVVPVDMLSGSLTMDPDDIGGARTPRTKAILVHHPWGVPARLDAIRAAAPDLPLISDCSHAHGASLAGKPLAAWSTIACFSLGRGKLVSGGELGCAATDDPELRDRMLVLGHVNRVPGDLRHISWQGNAVGLKLRPHPVALVLARCQLKRLDEKNALMRSAGREIEAELSPLGLVPQEVPEGALRSFWRIVMRLDGRSPGPDADARVLEAVTARLAQSGIPVEPPHYLPTLQDQPIFEWPGYERHILKRPCPTASREARRLLTLPAPVTLPQASRDALSRLSA